MTATTLRRGARIETTGEGRTARWGRYVGTVVRRFTNGDLGVQWDGGFVEDQMTPTEIKPLNTTRPGCPCAQCIHG